MGAQSADTVGRSRVVAIGLSRFQDVSLRPLPFASADAQAFAAAFRSGTSVIALTDSVATVGSVGDAFRSFFGDPTDAIYVFAATHATKDERNLQLHFYDGSVSLHETLSSLWNGPARRVVLLLDLFRGAAAGRPTSGDISALFSPREGRSLLLSDSGRHGSHVSGELQAGIWAAHVAAAFSGEAARARERDGTLTVGSLRTYLADEIPRSLARAYTDGRIQLPVLLAASNDELLAEPVPAGMSPADHKPALAGVRFFSESQVPVKSLGGFRKSVHSPPTDTLASSREWVAHLAEPDLAKELEDSVARLRRHLGYKRRDLRADGPAGGAATVLTPDFSYHLTAQQSADRPDRAVFRRSLAEVKTAAVLSSPSFGKAFPQGFHALFCPFGVPADIQALIDALEDAEPSGLSRLDYPTDLACCELELADFDGRVRIERSGVTITATRPAPPAALASQFVQVKRMLCGVTG